MLTLLIIIALFFILFRKFINNLRIRIILIFKLIIIIISVVKNMEDLFDD